MHAMLLDIEILLGMVFFVGSLGFAFVFSEDRQRFTSLPSPQLSIAFLAVWLVGLGLFLANFSNKYPTLVPGMLPTGGEDGGFALGFLGVILTALTGMALATAWRAIDDSRKARRISQDALDEIRSKEGEIEFELLRHAAYIDAINMKTAGRINEDLLTSKRYKVAQLFCGAFSCTSLAAASQVLSFFAKGSSLADEASRLATPRIRQYLELLSRDESVDIKKRVGVSSLL